MPQGAEVSVTGIQEYPGTEAAIASVAAPRTDTIRALDVGRTGEERVGAVRSKVEEFILDNLLFGDSARLPAPEDSLVQAGVIDSTGILELVEYIEQEFHITVDDTETVPENLDGIDRIVEFIARKQPKSTS